MKKLTAIVLSAALLMTGCSAPWAPKYEKYRYQFYNAFDTVIDLVAYCKSEEEFNRFAKLTEDSFQELHQIYDRFHTYPNVNNVKTINDNAGIEPVKVDERLIVLVKQAVEWYDVSKGTSDIAIGPVTSIWHEYMERYKGDSTGSEIPKMEALQAANKLNNIKGIVVDEAAGTIFLKEKGMELDLGGVAKGYATELVARKLEAAGLTSFLLSAGGNVRAGGKPLDGIRERWGVGIQNPDDLTGGENSLLDTVFVVNKSVVTSGDYQRYYMYGDQRMHHIIDPSTLMPATKYRAVTIVVPDSGLADMLSTALFLLDIEEGTKLAKSLGAEALWVKPDGSIAVTDGMQKIMKNLGGATGAKAE